LRQKLEEYARATHGTAPGDRDPRRAVEIGKEIGRIDWRDVDVPGEVLRFAREQERKVLQRKPVVWGFDCVPDALVRAGTPEKWATMVEQGVEDLLKSLGFATWKKLSGRKGSDPDVYPNGAAFTKVASAVLSLYSREGQELPPKVLNRMRDALIRIYGTYDLDTVQQSWEYGLIPAGWYLQFGCWLGDLRALSRATAMVDAWLVEPREAYVKNFHQAVVAIDRFTLGFAPHMEEVKASVLRRIKQSSKVPDGVKAEIKTPTG
jgi:hypothetical protein